MDEATITYGEIEKLQQQIEEIRKTMTGLRRQLPREEIGDYAFADTTGQTIHLADLFNGHDELILIHNMGKGCAYCTLWADGFNGMLHHFENRAGFAVVSPDAPSVQAEFARGRGWKFRMVSGKGTTFIDDMGFRSEKGGYMPGVSTFEKDKNGKIFRHTRDWFGPGDDYCSLWHLLELLPRGPDGWAPKFSY